MLFLGDSLCLILRPLVPWRKTRSRIAVEARRHPNADRSSLLADLKAERLAEHIRRTVDAAPTLDEAQRNRLALLLRGGGAA